MQFRSEDAHAIDVTLALGLGTRTRFVLISEYAEDGCASASPEVYNPQSVLVLRAHTSAQRRPRQP